MFPILSDIAEDAGQLALSHFGNLPIGSVDRKGALDLVTIADREVESLIQTQLLATFPEDGVFGEEGAAVIGSSGRTWVVDPIDGTFNFVRGGDQWSISIGLYQNGKPVWGIVHAPAAGITITGGREDVPRVNGTILPMLGRYDPERAAVGVSLGSKCPSEERVELVRFLLEDAGVMFRNCNSATHALIELATGEVDGHIALGESSWDVMGMWPTLVMLGAVSTLDWNGRSLNQTLKYAVGKPEVVQMCRHFVD